MQLFAYYDVLLVAVFLLAGLLTKGFTRKILAAMDGLGAGTGAHPLPVKGIVIAQF